MDLAPPQRAEFERTLGSKLWRLEHLYKIRDKKAGLVNLRLNNIQKAILTSIEDCLDSHGRIVKPIRRFYLKYRQGGVSTFWLLFWLDDTLFSPNKITGVLADEKQGLDVLFEIIRLAHDNMPDAYRPEVGFDSKSMLTFPAINSKIFVSLSIKSTALHNLHISEWAYCEDQDISNTLGACSPMTNITGETTGNGVGNDAYERYQDAKKGESEYKAFFFPWFIQEEYRVPLNGMSPAMVMGHLNKKERALQVLMKKDYGLALEAEQVLFRRAMVKEHRGLFSEKYPETDEDAFLTSGTKFFDPRKIHRLLLEAKSWVRDNPVVEDEDGDWIQWEQPTPKHIYAAAGDTAEGLDGDFCYLKIMCVTCRRDAFRFRARCGVDVFYRACDKWGRAYKNALLAIERNNHGHAVILGLEEICHYPNLYKEDDNTRAVLGLDKKEPKTGWLTDKASKPLILDQYKFAIEGDSDEDEDNFQPQFTVLDQVTITEALTFEQLDGKLKAIEGKHDDGVMASAIAYQMYKRLRRYVKTEKEVKAPAILVGAPRAIK